MRSFITSRANKRIASSSSEEGAGTLGGLVGIPEGPFRSLWSRLLRHRRVFPAAASIPLHLGAAGGLSDGAISPLTPNTPFPAGTGAGVGAGVGVGEGKDALSALASGLSSSAAGTSASTVASAATGDLPAAKGYPSLYEAISATAAASAAVSRRVGVEGGMMRVAHTQEGGPAPGVSQAVSWAWHSWWGVEVAMRVTYCHPTPGISGSGSGTGSGAEIELRTSDAGVMDALTRHLPSLLAELTGEVIVLQRQGQGQGQGQQ